jgi:3-phosphoshikimate 1-carboxyvinyltransferase
MKPYRIDADLAVPGDKSISHRALLLAAVAEGESRLRGVLPGADCRSTAAALRALGVPVPDLPIDGAEIRVSSGGIEGWREPAGTIDCGNSGTTARLLLGLLASRPFAARLSGDDSLRGRPMARIVEPLSRMGAEFRELGEPGRLPLEVRGGVLRGLDHRSPKASAQIKSAVLLAGLGAGVPVDVTEPGQSRDHTERMLAGLGVQVESAPVDGGWRVSLRPDRRPLPPLHFDVPGDPSSAAFLVALALLAEGGELRVRNVCVNPTRTGFLSILRRMGARVAVESERSVCGEPVADLVVHPSNLRGTEIGEAEIPATIDEIPVLAALAARAEGTTRIDGAGELRVKETDRIAALVSNLRTIGAEAEELPDGLVVTGADRPLVGSVTTHGDHRVAMAFGVLGALPGNRIRIDDPGCVEVSFPGFWTLLDGLVKGAGDAAPPVSRTGQPPATG